MYINVKTCGGSFEPRVYIRADEYIYIYVYHCCFVYVFDECCVRACVRLQARFHWFIYKTSERSGRYRCVAFGIYMYVIYGEVMSVD